MMESSVNSVGTSICVGLINMSQRKANPKRRPWQSSNQTDLPVHTITGLVRVFCTNPGPTRVTFQTQMGTSIVTMLKATIARCAIVARNKQRRRQRQQLTQTGRISSLQPGSTKIATKSVTQQALHVMSRVEGNTRTNLGINGTTRTVGTKQ